MADNWWGGGGESGGPSEADLQRAGYTFTGGDSGYWAPPVFTKKEEVQETISKSNPDNWMSGHNYDKSLINPSFDWQEYVNAPSNEDLRRAGIDTKAEAERHYALYGRNENRAGVAPLNPDWEWKESGLEPVWIETGEGGYTSYQSSGGSWQKKQGTPDVRLTLGADSVSNVSPIITKQGSINIGTKMMYNGVPVVYVPQEFANQGMFKDGTQYYSSAYLNKDLWQFAKPVMLDQSVLDSNSNLKSSLGDYQYKNYGYIIDQSKFNEYKANSVIQSKEWTTTVNGDQKKSVPLQGITERNGQLMYYGMRGGSSAGELTTFDASGKGMLNAWKSGSSGVIPRLGGYIGDFISDIRPIAQVASIFSPPVATFLAAYDATTAATQGKWGQAMMAALPMFVPSASGQPPIIDIPAVASATQSIASALNISTQAAGNMVRGAVELAANGGDLKQLLTKQVATYLGQQAGGFVEKLFTDNKLDKLGEVAKSVSAAGTRALLLNQNIGEATKSAFIKTAVPMAMETVPGWDSFAKSNPNAADDLKSAAVTAAQKGDFKAVVQDYSGRVIARAATDAAERELNAEGKSLTDSQKRLISTTVNSAIQGKPIDAALQRYAIDEAKRTVNDGIAVSQGWESDAQKTSAQKMYGNTIKPEEYIAKQQGWEDKAEKDAAFKAYGNTITPAGFKEREQVKVIDPTFDAEAYAKLNEVTGDPYTHFLEQGKQSNLPTNYEKGAEAALRSIGYKPDGDDIKNVADLFKQSANPDVALNQYYDQHWVTPEEAAAAAKDAGFELTPEQLSRYTGQTKTGQQAVLEDVSTAARIGKTAQDTRNAFIDKQLEPVIQAYKKEGYSDAEIQAALPGLRDQLNAAVGNKVTALSDYASQVKAVYGDKSPEYAEAQRRLLDAQSALGGYGVVKEGEQYKSAAGTYVPTNDPAMERVWARKEPTFDEIEAALRQGVKTGEEPEGVVTAKRYPAEVQSAIKDYMLGNKTSLDKYPDIKSDIDSYMKEASSGDILRLTGGAGAPSSAAQRLKQEYAVIGIPSAKPPVYSETGFQKTAIIGEIPSGTGTGKVPTLFGMPLSVSSMQFDSNSWVRLNDDTWVTPDSLYTFIAIPGKGGEVRENRTNNVVVTLPKEQIAPILPKPETPQTPITPVPPTAKPPEPKQTQVEEIIKEAERRAAEQRTSEAEISEMLKGMGYTPTPEEVSALAGMKTQEQAQKELQEYVNPRLVTADEVRQMYRDLGLMEPTEADIQRFTGQRAQAEVPELLKPYLPTASANVLTQQAEKDKLAMEKQQQQIGDINARINELQNQGMSQAEATTKALAELSAGQAGLGQKIGEVQTGLEQKLGGLESGLSDALKTLGSQFGKTTTGLQQQLQQAQDQANVFNLLTLLGMSKQQQQPAAPIPLVGKITPYEFSTDLLAGIYQPPKTGLFGTNQQLLNLSKG